MKVVDGLVYRRSEHATCDQLHATFICKLGITDDLVPEVLDRKNL